VAFSLLEEVATYGTFAATRCAANIARSHRRRLGRRTSLSASSPPSRLLACVNLSSWLPALRRARLHALPGDAAPLKTARRSSHQRGANHFAVLATRGEHALYGACPLLPSGVATCRCLRTGRRLADMAQRKAAAHAKHVLNGDGGGGDLLSCAPVAQPAWRSCACITPSPLLGLATSLYNQAVLEGCGFGMFSTFCCRFWLVYAHVSCSWACWLGMEDAPAAWQRRTAASTWRGRFTRALARSAAFATGRATSSFLLPSTQTRAGACAAFRAAALR